MPPDSSHSEHRSYRWLMRGCVFFLLCAFILALRSPGRFASAYTGMGAGGQYITVLPQPGLVIAHKTDSGQPSPHGPTGRRRNVTPTG